MMPITGGADAGRVRWAVSPVQGVEVLLMQRMEQMWDHLDDSLGGFGDVAPVLGLGVLPLHHLLLGILLQPLVECAEALRRAWGAVPPQRVVLLRDVVPALVLVHNYRVLVGVLLQDADVRLDQPQQVQLLRECEVGGPGFPHHAGCHEHSSHSCSCCAGLSVLFFYSPSSSLVSISFLIIPRKFLLTPFFSFFQTHTASRAHAQQTLLPLPSHNAHTKRNQA